MNDEKKAGASETVLCSARAWTDFAKTQTELNGPSHDLGTNRIAGSESLAALQHLIARQPIEGPQRT